MKQQLFGIVVVLFLSFNAYSQTDRERAKWAAETLGNSKALSAAEKSKVAKFDFGSMWVHDDERGTFLGYIGSDYQRLRLVILSAVKDPTSPGTYRVTGKTKVKDVIRSFTGTIKITMIATASGAKLEEDYKVEQIKEAGKIGGEYHFVEDPKETGTGRFDGVFATDWYIDRNGKLQYDEVMAGADGYLNNQFLGTWTSYRSKVKKPASWGDSRIPLSGDLDMGSGEFAPDEKYLRNGWQIYRDAYSGQNDRALTEEKKQWWK